MKIHKLAPFIFALAIAVTSCEQSAESTETVRNEEEVQSSNALVTGTSNANATQKPSSSTKIEFDTTVHHFGTIRQGQMVSHTFKFKNVGNAPLIISDAKASCGCTVPEYPKGPVAPGEEGEIVVKYNGSGRGEIHKTVNITANTESPSLVLEIKANVKAMDMNLKGPVNKSE